MAQTESTPRINVNIRTATSQDAQQLYLLRLEALRMHPDAFAADVDITMSNGVEEWGRLIENYAKDQSGIIFVASAEDKIVGMTGLVRGHWPKTRHRGLLWGIYVKPDWRGRHIGGGLINGCAEWAKVNHMTMLTLGVNIQNTQAIHCYTRCGFSTYATEPRAILDRGNYHDEYLMFRFL